MTKKTPAELQATRAALRAFLGKERVDRAVRSIGLIRDALRNGITIESPNGRVTIALDLDSDDPGLSLTIDDEDET
jgi:hypothetical protein